MLPIVWHAIVLLTPLCRNTKNALKNCKFLSVSNVNVQKGQASEAAEGDAGNNAATAPESVETKACSSENVTKDATSPSLSCSHEQISVHDLNVK